MAMTTFNFVLFLLYFFVAGATATTTLPPDNSSMPDNNTTILCPPMQDGYLGWAGTPAGVTAWQNCPSVPLSNPDHLASRLCGFNGTWVGRNVNDTDGWTNFSLCFPETARILLSMLDPDPFGEEVLRVAKFTRYIEIVGYVISLFSVITSVIVFKTYPSLKCLRTAIHTNLFMATLLENACHISVYSFQEIIKYLDAHEIELHPWFCKILYIFLEYSISVMFTWMLIEGVFLDSQLSGNNFTKKISFKTYCLIGWFSPVLSTGIWAYFTWKTYKDEKNDNCWFGYTLKPSYIITQGLRWLYLLSNLVVLIRAMRTLIMKMNDSNKTEYQKLKKGVRAIICLVPLLGINFMFDMFEAPITYGIMVFKVWSYTSYILRSFEGLFISYIYCFSNAEVREAVKNSWTRRQLKKKVKIVSPSSKVGARLSIFEMLPISNNEGSLQEMIICPTRSEQTGRRVDQPIAGADPKEEDQTQRPRRQCRCKRRARYQPYRFYFNNEDMDPIPPLPWEIPKSTKGCRKNCNEIFIKCCGSSRTQRKDRHPYSARPRPAPTSPHAAMSGQTSHSSPSPPPRCRRNAGPAMDICSLDSNEIEMQPPTTLGQRKSIRQALECHQVLTVCQAVMEQDCLAGN